MENNSMIKSLLKFIYKAIDDRLNQIDVITTGIITSVNPNKTVNLYVPPSTTEFTQILNQSPFELKVGDTVKLIKEKGKASNMWVIAKCNDTYQTPDIENLVSNKLFPVGSTYICVNTLDPNTFLYGEWGKIDEVTKDLSWWKRIK